MVAKKKKIVIRFANGIFYPLIPATEWVRQILGLQRFILCWNQSFTSLLKALNSILNVDWGDISVGVSVSCFPLIRQLNLVAPINGSKIFGLQEEAREKMKHGKTKVYLSKLQNLFVPNCKIFGVQEEAREKRNKERQSVSLIV